jgi:ABC-2 type transport system ATP-binding protein
MEIINVEHLSKIFYQPIRGKSIGAFIKSVIRPNYREIRAVNDISFNIAKGELVGFIGPNGAGK